MPRHSRIWRLLFLLLMSCCTYPLIATASGQQPSPTSGSDDLSALLKRMEVNVRANKQLASRYTFDSTTSCKIYSNKGKLLSDYTDKWVTVTIDGVQYDRIVEENGKPLSRRKQIAEQRRSDAQGQLGKDYDFVFDNVTYPDNSVYSDLPISYLDTLFDNQVVGHELINGRDNLVVESTPKVDANPGSDRAKMALDWKETTWIDTEDAMPSRYDVELINRKTWLLKGTTSSTEFTKVPVMQIGNQHLPPYVWLVHIGTGRFIFSSPTNSELFKGEYYNYKRFQSDARVYMNSVNEAPAASAGK
jgi:hypothetical protein